MNSNKSTGTILLVVVIVLLLCNVVLLKYFKMLCFKGNKQSTEEQVWEPSQAPVYNQAEAAYD